MDVHLSYSPWARQNLGTIWGEGGGGGGGAKDLEYHLVGRINVNKILHDKPTKSVAYCINLAF